MRGMVSNPSSETTFTLFFSVKLFPSLTIFPAKNVSSVTTGHRWCGIRQKTSEMERNGAQRGLETRKVSTVFVIISFISITANVEKEAYQLGGVSVRAAVLRAFVYPSVGERAGFV